MSDNQLLTVCVERILLYYENSMLKGNPYLRLVMCKEQSDKVPAPGTEPAGCGPPRVLTVAVGI